MERMNRKSVHAKASMNADEFAGFLRLWLTPSSRVPALTEDVMAYLRYANRREPVRSCTGHLPTPSKHAA
jgi:hypothetical protein